MSTQEANNPLPQAEQSNQECLETDQTGSVLQISTYQASISECTLLQIKATEQTTKQSQLKQEKNQTSRSLLHSKGKQGSQSSKLKQQIKRLNEINQTVTDELSSYQMNSASLKKENMALSIQKQHLLKLNKEMNDKYDYFQVQLQLITNRNQQIPLTQHQITSFKQRQHDQIQAIPLLVPEQINQHIQNDQFHTETYQKMDILYKSLLQLQTESRNRAQQYATQSLNKHSQIVDLELTVKRLEQANHQLTNTQTTIQAGFKQHDSQRARFQEANNTKDIYIFQLRQQIERLSQANAQLQQYSATLIINNYQSFQALTQQLKSQNNHLIATVSTINKQKQLLALQLLQQKENSFLLVQTNSQLQSQIQQQQTKINQLDQTLQQKQDQISNIHKSYQDTLQQSVKFISELIQANKQKCQSLIQEAQMFYSSLIHKKQQNWQQIKMMLVAQIELNQFMNHRNTQRESQSELRLANQIQTNKMQIKNFQDKFNQLLSLSETQILNMSKQLDRTRWQLQNCRQSQCQARKQLQRLADTLNIIASYSSVSDLMDKLNMINERKVLDGVILAFISIEDLIANLKEQNSQHLLRIDKQSAQIELIKSEFTQKDKQISLMKQAIDQEETQHQLKYASLLQKCQQYNQKAQDLKHKLEQNRYSEGELSQKYSELQQRYKQVLIYNQQFQQNLATIQEQQVDIDTQESKDSQISKMKNEIFKLQQTIDQLNQSIQKMSDQQNKTKQQNTRLCGINVQLKQENTSFNKSQQRLARCSKIQRDVQNLIRQNNLLKYKLEQTKGIEQSQMNSSYQQLYQTAKQQKDLIEAQLIKLKAKYDKLRTNKQPSKNINIPIQFKEHQGNHSHLNSFFVMASLIETYSKGTELLISTIEQNSSRQVHQIKMIFRMDDNNKANFHSTFKATDLNDGVYAYLFKKGNNAFGFLTFSQKIKGSPSAIMFSLNNNICIFKDEQKYQTTAFKYDFNTIYFGNNEAKFKSGSKYFSASDGGGYRKYFGKYSKAEIFGEEFKESLEIQQFEIHKVII